MNRRLSQRSSACVGAVLALGVLSFSFGCRSGNESARMDIDAPERISTPSVENVRRVEASPSTHSRTFETVSVSAKRGTVTHTPLLYEDPCEIPGDRLTFEYTGEDYFHLLYGPIRYLASTVLVPVSAIKEPLWRLQESDGQLQMAKANP